MLLALQQDARTYAGSLTYGVRLQVNVGLVRWFIVLKKDLSI